VPNGFQKKDGLVSRMAFEDDLEGSVHVFQDYLKWHPR
jgi:hypothetical protein